ncbi:MAG: hypothetical protein FJ134_12430 [Deltaproteobacteria bacterium]|nr:hypothetical protein [Deltaproteobacteria bacterium]
MDFFGISFTELVVLAALAFILFGPEKLPEYAEKAGRLVARLRQSTAEMTEQYKKPFQEAKESFRSTAASFPKVPPIPPPPSEFLNEIECPQCGHVVDREFRFCPSCGHNLKEESPYSEVPHEFPCPECLITVTRDFIFCPHCGCGLEEHKKLKKPKAKVN